MPRASWCARSARSLFGRIGDLVGRKYTFLVTILVMGASTFAVGLLPTYATIGWLAPILLVSLRLLQGLALGGEYGGAATYVAEHARTSERGYATSWIQTTATLGFFMALGVIGLCRVYMDAKMFAEWGWRIPFLVSLILLVFSVYIRLKLNETPIFQKMKEEGKGSKSPLTDSFLRYPNNKYVLLALLGATAGQGVVWYTGQFYALFFLTITLKLDYPHRLYPDRHVADHRHAVLHLLRLAVRPDRPAEDHPGRLPDRGGHLLPAVRRADPLRQSGPRGVPGRRTRSRSRSITSTCHFHIFVGPWSKFSDCDRAKDFLTKLGPVVQDRELAGGQAGDPDDRLGPRSRAGTMRSLDRRRLPQAGYPAKADPAKINCVDGRADPGHHGDLRHHGVRPDRRLPGRIVPDQDPLHVDVAALSHRQWLVRRHAAAARDRDRGRDRRYL